MTAKAALTVHALFQTVPPSEPEGEINLLSFFHLPDGITSIEQFRIFLQKEKIKVNRIEISLHFLEEALVGHGAFRQLCHGQVAPVTCDGECVYGSISAVVHFLHLNLKETAHGGIADDKPNQTEEETA